MAAEMEMPMVITRIVTNITGTTTIPTDVTIHTTDTNITIDGQSIAMTATIITTVIVIMLMPRYDMCIPITTVTHVNIG